MFLKNDETMKNRALFFFVVMTASFHVSGQDTVYFTKTWKPCPKNDSYYYRVLTKDTAGYKVSDHFPNGTIQMVGYSRSKDTVKLDGPCAFYTEKGRITKQ